MNTLIKGTSERSMNNTSDMGGGGGGALILDDPGHPGQDQ